MSNNINRAQETRRDNDTQPTLSISLYDIDETILNHLKNNLKLQVEHNGVVKIPSIQFGSQELWKAMQKDSFIRDYQGKIIIPAIILKRTTSDSDEQFTHFNRYLAETVIKTYSEKNQYTRFSVLNGRNAPVHEVYNITFPSHMKLTYRFIIWTEYIEQMNKLIETLQFNIRDYWGTKNGYKFRVDAASFGHTVELQSGDDRLIKTEFDLHVHGYILPDTITKLNSQQSTFKKILTPKKIIMGTEVVNTDKTLKKYPDNDKKWKNQQYPNKDANEPISSAPLSISDGITDNSGKFVSNSIVNTLTNIFNTPNSAPVYPNLRAVSRPLTNERFGQEGDISYDEDYFYLYTNKWNRFAIRLGGLNLVQPPNNMTDAGHEGEVAFDERYFYIYSTNQWRRVAISSFS